jgi:hypothetical protein
MEDETIVNEEESVIETPEPEEEVLPQAEPVPGSKTDPALLLKEVHKWRGLARTYKEEAETYKNATTPEVFSDEGKALEAKIDRIAEVVLTTQSEKKREALETTYPALKVRGLEFDEFLTDPLYEALPLETAAKVFLAERNLLAKPSPRKGLEKDTGGGRVPTKTGLSPDEIDELRQSNYPEYVKRIKNGTLFS